VTCILDRLLNHSHKKQHLFIAASISFQPLLSLSKSFFSADLFSFVVVFFCDVASSNGKCLCQCCRYFFCLLDSLPLVYSVRGCMSVWVGQDTNLHISYIRIPTANIHTHVVWAWSVGVWPRDQLVSQASHTMCDASPSTLTSTLWKLASQNFLTCQARIDDEHHQTESHGHRASKVLSSALSPTSPLADYSPSAVITSLGLYNMIISHILQRVAMLARYMLSSFVCLSVCSSVCHTLLLYQMVNVDHENDAIRQPMDSSFLVPKNFQEVTVDCDYISIVCCPNYLPA